MGSTVSMVTLIRGIVWGCCLSAVWISCHCLSCIKMPMTCLEKAFCSLLLRCLFLWACGMLVVKCFWLVSVWWSQIPNEHCERLLLSYEQPALFTDGKQCNDIWSLQCRPRPCTLGSAAKTAGKQSLRKCFVQWHDQYTCKKIAYLCV